jgi:hypothetical protein
VAAVVEAQRSTIQKFAGVVVRRYTLEVQALLERQQQLAAPVQRPPRVERHLLCEQAIHCSGTFCLQLLQEKGTIELATWIKIYDTSMCHYTWYLVPCNELSL